MNYPIPPGLLSSLPPLLVRHMYKITRTTECDLLTAAALSISAFAGIVNSRARIRPKGEDISEFEVPGNLYTLVVSPPSTGKTGAFKSAYSVVEKLQMRANLKYLAEKKQYDALVRTKKKNDVVHEEAPSCATYLINDATVEALQEILSTNPQGICVFRDELSGLLSSFEAKGHEQSRSFYLTAWEGCRSYSVHRILRGTVIVENACLSVAGGVPTDVFKYYINKAQGKYHDGLLERFQFLFALGDRIPGAEKVIPQDKSIDRDIEDLYCWVSTTETGRARIVNSGTLAYALYLFDESVQEDVLKWYQDWQCRIDDLNCEGKYWLTSRLGKYKSLVAKLAMLFQLVVNFEEGVDRDVGRQCWEWALWWIDRLEEQLTNFNVESETGGTKLQPSHIIERLRGKFKAREFTVREAQRFRLGSVDGNNTKEQVLTVLNALCQRGVLARIDDSTFICTNVPDRKREASLQDIRDYLPNDYPQTTSHISCLSPDHTDRNPSMIVNKPSGEYKNHSYHCFSCGVRYNTTVQAAMAYLQVEEPEAIDWLLAHKGDVVIDAEPEVIEVNEIAATSVKVKKREKKVEKREKIAAVKPPRKLQATKEIIIPPGVEEYWEASNEFCDLDTNDYLERKRMPSDGLRFNLADACVVVPVRHVETGQLISCQKIRGTNKLFLKGSKATLGVFTYGTLTETRTRVYLCEGVATAHAVYKATGCVSIACLSTTNLVGVTKSLMYKHDVVVCLEFDEASRKTHAKLEKLRGDFEIISAPMAKRGGDFCDVYVESGESGVNAALQVGADNLRRLLAGVDFKDFINVELRSNALGLMSCRYVDDFERANVALSKLREDQITGLDFETTGLYPREGAEVRLMQVYQSGGQPLVVDVMKCGGLLRFKDFLTSQRHFVSHNALFEMSFLKAVGIEVVLDCTMLAFHSVEGLQIAQDDLALDILGFDYDLLFGSKKLMQTSDWGGDLSEKQIMYAATDAWVVVKLWENIARNELVYQRMRAAQVAALDVSTNGFTFDEVAHRKFIEKKKGELESKRGILLDLIPGLFDEGGTMKTAALSKYFSAVEGWPNTETSGKPCADAATVVKFKDKLDPEFFDAYNRFQKLKTFINTFGEKYNIKDGRAYGSFNLCGTKTGRLSCDKSNLQNVPSRGEEGSEFRGFFKAPEGKVLLVADYGQEELRILAVETGEEKMLNAFRTGLDLHTLTASLVYNKDIDAVEKFERALGKTLNFGLAYGASASKFIEVAAKAGITLTLEEAKKAKDGWFAAYPEVANWHRSIKARGCDLQSVTRGGRIRKFLPPEKMFDTETRKYRPNPYATVYIGSFKPDYYSLNEAYNTPIQGGGADVLLEVMRDLPTLVRDYKAKLVNLVHDEVVIEVCKQEAELMKPQLQKLMVDACLRIYPQMPTLGLVEVNICKTWGEK